ncbi:MAG: MCE family protein, partial [Pyrinomonadaceae bacterium]|nr:MCE family protein [Pyrinomonadaceae bacterium]
GTVGKLFTDDQLYSNVNQVSAEVNKLIYDFRQNPKKYLTIKFELF